ncbi:MAG: hypothetical protein WBL57_07790 [Methylovirgula sp.]
MSIAAYAPKRVAFVLVRARIGRPLVNNLRGNMMIANWLLRLAVVLGIVGMVFGLVMGIRNDFTLVAVHAHLNLLGWVGLFLAGLYYQAVPTAAASRLAHVHAWTAMAGAIIFPIGIAAILLGGQAYLPITVIGSLVVLAAMALFAVVIFKFGTAPAVRKA